MTRDILLSARGVSKRFCPVQVLHDVSFDVHRGEVLGILGPNGAGKTTLFNMISGDLRESGGEIRLGDRRLGREPPFRRCRMGIGRTYQIPLPYAGMTTFENLLVAAAFGGGLRERDSYDRCAQNLRDCDLEPRANLRAGALTLLDRTRLELARALALNPTLLLLDEIAGGLTEAESHALVAAADRLMVLNFGEKIAEGAPGAVIEDPPADRMVVHGIAIVPEGRRSGWTRARVEALFPILAEKSRTPVQTLSGGQQQMVALGRALLCQPEVLLCDEISLGLAPKVIGEIYAALPGIRAEGTAVRVVEQDVGLAPQASDRLYCLLEGRVTLSGRSRDLSRARIGEAYFGTHHAMA